MLYQLLFIIIHEQLILADIGQFEPNFNLGLQLRTLVTSAVLLYMEDAFALQIVNGKVSCLQIPILQMQSANTIIM